MEHLLARSADVLQRLASESSLLVFDFDGTLAPIVADRDAARLRRSTAALLADVARRYPCAVLSGRARADVLARIDGVALAHVVGNHGIEPSPEMAGAAEAVTAIRAALRDAVAGLEGVDIEDKRFSLAVHFRAAPDRARAADAVRAAIRSLPRPMRVVDGDCVVNAVPVGGPNKGDAMVRLIDEADAKLALFVGDDVTDEDVFRLDDPRLIGVRVGHSPSSRAGWFLRDQGEIDELLRALVAMRTAA